MKRFFRTGWAKGLLVAGFVSFSVMGVFLLTSSASADVGTSTNRLWSLGKNCHTIPNTTNGDFSAPWFEGSINCNDLEKKITENLDCASDGLFYSVDRVSPTDNSNVVPIWYVNPTAIKECYDKAKALLDTFAAPGKVCYSGDRGSPNHNRCKNNQEHLHETLGCSSFLIGDAGENGYEAIGPLVQNCSQRLSLVGDLKLTLAKDDGTEFVATTAVRDIGTAADTEDLGSIGGGAGGGSGETGTNCQGGALGWVLCPLIDYMTQALRVVAGLIDGLMQVRFLAQDDSSKPIELAWRAFLSVANILLVVAFMVIIFSQSTSLGLSNYGIKRMLPRLVIAAILMNVSFYICALAIDVSNIIGSSIMGFLVGSGNSIADSMTRATGGSTGLLGSVTNVGISAVLVFIAIMFLAPVVLSILLVFIMLIGRQVVLMVLVLVSPLAFVAWLLPNTEQYFKKWYGLFSELLILYPLVMLIFGASLYMANVIGGSDIFNGVI